MTLRECYDALEGSYDEVVSRLRSERLIQKFVLKFLDDGSFALLEASMASGSREEAFRAAHTIKGMCQNLSFTRLGNTADEVTEALRNSWPDNAGELMEKIRRDYELTAGAIRRFREEQGL